MTREADRWQAQYFHDELHRQIGLVNEQAAVFRRALVKYLRRGESGQVRRIQAELRRNAVERRKLTDMLTALNDRFLSDETVRPTAGHKQRRPAALASLTLAAQRRSAIA